MPKYLLKNYFAHGSFPEVGQKQKTEKILQGLRVAQAACVRHACLRAPCVLACAMRSLAIVITIVQSLFLSLSVFCF